MARILKMPDPSELQERYALTEQISKEAIRNIILNARNELYRELETNPSFKTNFSLAMNTILLSIADTINHVNIVRLGDKASIVSIDDLRNENGVFTEELIGLKLDRETSRIMRIRFSKVINYIKKYQSQVHNENY